MFNSVILVVHYIELVETYLRYVVIRFSVSMFLEYDNKCDGCSFIRTSFIEKIVMSAMVSAEVLLMVIMWLCRIMELNHSMQSAGVEDMQDVRMMCEVSECSDSLILNPRLG